MRRVFEGCTDIPIGSLKSNLGHSITAAGAAGLGALASAGRTLAAEPAGKVYRIGVVSETTQRFPAASPEMLRIGALGNPCPVA